MKELFKNNNPTDDCCPQTSDCCDSKPFVVLPMAQEAVADEPCCGPPQGPPSSPHERPGYSLCRFVDSFTETASGQVPKVVTRLGFDDYMGTIRARLGVNREQYKVAPGLYSVGYPTPDSSVLVTANYKLSFDALRSELKKTDAWILVLDTRGINVWCAAGKRTFCTEEVVRQVRQAQLDKIVNHRQLILPQLGAPGVSAHKVKKECGFQVIWGPIHAKDLKSFLGKDLKADPEMRKLTFTFWERLVLVPVEMSLIIKPSLWVLLALFVLSGISPDGFSLSSAWFRGGLIAAFYVLGVAAGAVAVPLLLPWLPGTSFYLKGIVSGAVFGFASAVMVPNGLSIETLAMILTCVAVSSCSAMNFTGATPYASPSGVEKEMKRGIPIQIIMALCVLVLWVGAPFGIGG